VLVSVAILTRMVTEFIPRAEIIQPWGLSLGSRVISAFPLSASLPVRSYGRVRPRPREWVKYASVSLAYAGLSKEPGYQLSLTFRRCRLLSRSRPADPEDIL